MSFPLPEPTPLSKPYWDALGTGGSRSSAAGSVSHAWLPARAECPECLAAEWDWQTASGKGRVISWVIYHHAYHEAFKERVPYNVDAGRARRRPAPHHQHRQSGGRHQSRAAGDAENRRRARRRARALRADMSQQVVIVTGGSRGIGAATARLLGEQKASVIVNYRNAKDRGRRGRARHRGRRRARDRRAGRHGQRRRHPAPVRRNRPRVRPAHRPGEQRRRRRRAEAAHRCHHVRRRHGAYCASTSRDRSCARARRSGGCRPRPAARAARS